MWPNTPTLLSDAEVARLLEDGDRRAFIWRMGAHQLAWSLVAVVVVDLVRYFFHHAPTLDDLVSSASIVLIFSLGGWGSGWLLWKAGFRPRRPRREFMSNR